MERILRLSWKNRFSGSLSRLHGSNHRSEDVIENENPANLDPPRDDDVSGLTVKSGASLCIDDMRKDAKNENYISLMIP